MPFWRREDPVVAILRDEVAYLRAQLEAGREREDTLRRELITIASSRAAADIAYYEQARTPRAQPDRTFVWPGKRPGETGPTPFDNHLAGGEHLEPDPEPGPRPGDLVDEDALAEATIEQAARDREQTRLKGIMTVAD
jgi:hypothetical protein